MWCIVTRGQVLDSALTLHLSFTKSFGMELCIVLHN